MKQIFFLSTILFFLLGSCEKDQNRKLLGAYFKYTINGTEKIIKDETGISENMFNCTIKGDTSLIINAAKFYEGAGFVIRSSSIKDGSYVLDNGNKAYYTNPVDLKRYYTTGKHTGTLTVKKNTFTAKELLYTLEGTFAFQAVDTLTGKTFNITNGSFLMERKELK